MTMERYTGPQHAHRLLSLGQDGQSPEEDWPPGGLTSALEFSVFRYSPHHSGSFSWKVTTSA